MTQVIDPTADTLLGIRVLRGLSPDARAAIAACCRGAVYDARTEIVHHLEPTSEVYFVVGGKVRATILSPNGREVSFRDLGPGEMFGDLSAVDGEPRCASVVSLEETVVVVMSAAEFRETLLAHPSVALVVIEELVGLVRSLSERVVELSTLGVKNRIHAELLRLARQEGSDENEIAIARPTHADLASRVSTHREAVTKELSHLAELGLVEKDGSNLVIRDVDRLARLVEEVFGTHP